MNKEDKEKFDELLKKMKPISKEEWDKSCVDYMKKNTLVVKEKDSSGILRSKFFFLDEE